MNPRKNIRRFVSLPTIKREIEKAGQNGYNSLGFLGGEPTIYPSILDLIKHAVQCNFKKIHIVSNGRRYSDKKFLKNLLDSGVTRFSVSVHSHQESTEDNLTKVKDGFKEKIRGIKNLTEFSGRGLIKEPISINIVVNKMNYQNMPDTIKFFNKMGVNDFRLNFIRPEGRAADNFNEVVLKYSDFSGVAEEILRFAKSNGVSLNIGDMPLCTFKDTQLILENDGNLKDYYDDVLSFNDTMPLATIPSKRFFSWKKERLNRHKIKGGECNKCYYNPYCEGPWKNYVKKFGFSEFKAIGSAV